MEMDFSVVSETLGLSTLVAVMVVLPGFFAIKVTLFPLSSLATTSKSTLLLQARTLFVASIGLTTAVNARDSPLVMYASTIVLSSIVTLSTNTFAWKVLETKVFVSLP